MPIVPWHGPPLKGAPDLPIFLARGRVDSTVLIYSNYSLTDMKSVSDDAVSKNCL